MIEYVIFQLGCSNSEKSVKMRSKQQAYTHIIILLIIILLIIITIIIIIIIIIIFI